MSVFHFAISIKKLYNRNEVSLVVFEDFLLNKASEIHDDQAIKHRKQASVNDHTECKWVLTEYKQWRQ